VGCGRSGSLVADLLARLGLRSLTLIDADGVEEHNLAEMALVTSADCGRPKAVALADHLRRALAPESPVLIPVVASITAPEAYRAALDCDVLVCCPDNDAARLATALVATLFH
jgi:molybdopterin/thiamine biosynthesis adenylyltransferase